VPSTAQRLPTLTWLEATAGDPALEPLWKFLQERCARATAGRFTTRLQHVAINTGGIRHAAGRLINDAALLASAVAAEKYSDVMVLGCWGSPVREVRSAVAIPVASLPEASAVITATLARRAVVITVAPSLTPIFCGELASYGSAGFADEAVRSYTPESTHTDVVEAITKPAALIDRFNAAAVQAVDRGADAIVVGCGYLAPIFTAHGYAAVLGHPDVPVYDCNRLAIEHASHLYALAQSGIRPASRTYGQPKGRQGAALAAALSNWSRGDLPVA
jgi:Asp/Glu/hydantoin racemase